MKSVLLSCPYASAKAVTGFFLMVFLSTVSKATIAEAGPPLAGTYASVDVPGGTFHAGRFSESWAGTSGYGTPGNTFHGQSWDGSVLGNQWTLCAPVDRPPILVSDTRDETGTGDVAWRTEYEDGRFWFSSEGPWGDGSQDYPGEIWLFVATTLHSYDQGVLQETETNIVLSGPMDFWGNCIEMAIHEVAVSGDTNENGPKPLGYPEFLGENCVGGIWSQGSWGTLASVYLRVLSSFCSFLPTEPSTWGKIKSLYAD